MRRLLLLAALTALAVVAFACGTSAPAKPNVRVNGDKAANNAFSQPDFPLVLGFTIKGQNPQISISAGSLAGDPCAALSINATIPESALPANLPVGTLSTEAVDAGSADAGQTFRLRPTAIVGYAELSGSCTNRDLKGKFWAGVGGSVQLTRTGAGGVHVDLIALRLIPAPAGGRAAEATGELVLNGALEVSELQSLGGD